MSAGIVSFMLLCGYPPFWGNDKRETMTMILFQTALVDIVSLCLIDIGLWKLKSYFYLSRSVYDDDHVQLGGLNHRMNYFLKK